VAVDKVELGRVRRNAVRPFLLLGGSLAVSAGVLMGALLWGSGEGAGIGLIGVLYLLGVWIEWRASRDVFSPTTFLWAFWAYLYFIQPAVEWLAGNLSALEVARVSLYSFVSLILLSVGYRLRVRACRWVPSLLSARWNQGRVWLVFIVGYAGIWLMRLHLVEKGGLIQGGVTTIERPDVGILEKVLETVFASGAGGNVLPLLVMLLLVQWSESRRRLALRTALVVGIASFELVVAYMTGWRSSAGIFILTLLFIYNYASRRLGVAKFATFAGIGMLVTVFLAPVWGMYRVGAGLQRVSSISEAMNLAAETVREFGKGGWISGVLAERGLSAALVLDAHRNLDFILTAVPARHDFFYGKTILGQVLRYPLRFLGWTDMDWYTETGVQNFVWRELGLLRENETGVFLTFPFHGELYANFGWIGLVLLPVWGAGYRFCYELWRRNGRAVGWILFYWLIWYFGIFQGSYYSIGTMFLVILVKGVVFWPVVRFVASRGRALPAEVR
jgi:hypothetical protein